MAASGSDGAGHHHRSTLKQKNKPFKARHASKGSLKALAKGRQESTTKSHLTNGHAAKQNLKNTALARRNYAKQIQLQKRRAIADAGRVFHGPNGAPRVIVVCSLTHDVDCWSFVRALENGGEEADIRTTIDTSTFSEFYLTRYKTKLQVHPVPYGALYPLLDAAKAADFVLILLSPHVSIESGSWGETAMRVLQAQGLPTVVPACVSLADMPVKAANEVRKSLLSFTQYFAPEAEKVYALHDRNELSSLLRTMATSAPRRIAWRDFRSWLVSEESEYDEVQGVLRVTGWIRGAPMSANRLVHIPDFGDFSISKITEAKQQQNRQTHAKGKEIDMDLADPIVLDERHGDVADDLVSENALDDLQNEQTWPTAQEMANGARSTMNVHEDEIIPPAQPGTTPISIRKTDPTTTKRQYAANWIVEEDDDEEESIDEDEESQHISDGVNGNVGEDDVEEEDGSLDLNFGRADKEDEYDEEFEARQLAEYKSRMAKERERRKESEQEREFPDEVDTPLEVPARIRFQRYRGLKSLRTSPWDPYEDLPREYARIFQFDDYKKTRRRVEASIYEEGVEPGTRVTLWVKDVPKEAAERCCGDRDPVPFVVFCLLRHEHKKSVLNFTVARNTEYEASVKSKDTLILCLGARRMRVNPIFSQHDPGNDGRSGTNNVHKMERYLHGVGTQGYVAVGTVIGPITFGGANVPAVLLRERILDGESGYDEHGVGATQMPHLVGTGTLMDADPTRILAKRIVLTGHPYKVHKRTSTIRFMFFNPEDVQYFAPLELRTKLGRVGHISESLGTHGYFKAHFDGKVPLSQLDTVGMTLYKRSFPKFAQIFTQSRQEMPDTSALNKDGEQNDVEMM